MRQLISKELGLLSLGAMATAGITLSLAACQQVDESLADFTGNYVGTLTLKGDAGYQQLAVSAQFSDNKKDGKVLSINQGDQRVADAEFSHVGAQSLELSAGDRKIDHEKLTRDENCYTSQDAGKGTSRVCFARGELILELRGASGAIELSATLNRPGSEKAAALEAPTDFTLDQAVERASKMNFDTQVEFEHVLQAKLTARSAYRFLVPKATFSTLYNNLPKPSFSSLFNNSLVNAIGDVAPFVFPSRWFQARALAQQSSAERMSLLIMRMDTAYQVESLYQTYKHDEAVLAFYEAMLRRTFGAREQLRIGERIGQYSDGATDGINFVVTSIKAAREALQHAHRETQTSISQTLGFYNPDGVNKVILPPEPDDLDKVSPLGGSRDLAQMAVDRAFELKQLDDLIKVAKNNRKVTVFGWIDPAVNVTQGLGWGFGDQLRVNSSQIREAEDRRGQMEAAIRKRVDDSVNEFNAALSAYKYAKESVAESARPLQKQLDFMRVGGGDPDFVNLVSLFQNYLASQIGLQDAVLQYRLARAKLDRYLLRGYFMKPELYYQGISLAGAPTPTPAPSAAPGVH